MNIQEKYDMFNMVQCMYQNKTGLYILISVKGYQLCNNKEKYILVIMVCGKYKQ